MVTTIIVIVMRIMRTIGTIIGTIIITAALLDRGLGIGDGRGLRSVVGLAPAHVLVVGLQVGLGILLGLDLHLLGVGGCSRK